MDQNKYEAFRDIANDKTGQRTISIARSDLADIIQHAEDALITVAGQREAVFQRLYRAGCRLGPLDPERDYTRLEMIEEVDKWLDELPPV